MLTVAILGATGAVGHEFLSILAERHFPIGELRLLASPRSAGSDVPFRGKPQRVTAVSAESFVGVDLALFSAGAGTSREWAPIATAAGAIVVDNSSAFRGDAGVPLVVPEVNSHMLATRPAIGIIAVPNCSTIPVVHVLKPLHEAWGLRRIIASTYQSTSGAGAAAMEELREQTRARLSGADAPPPAKFPHPIAFNVIPQVDSFLPDGYTKEEQKMLHESRKIMELLSLRVSCTCVRVPTLRSHGVSVNAEFASRVDAAEARRILAAMRNVVVLDDPDSRSYPMPLTAEGRDETFVGRIRLDQSNPDGTSLDLFVVADNLRKGAALNAVQIAEGLLESAVLRGAVN